VAVRRKRADGSQRPLPANDQAPMTNDQTNPKYEWPILETKVGQSVAVSNIGALRIGACLVIGP
jgi:hypothetical protein